MQCRQHCPTARARFQKPVSHGDGVECGGAPPPWDGVDERVELSLTWWGLADMGGDRCQVVVVVLNRTFYG